MFLYYNHITLTPLHTDGHVSSGPIVPVIILYDEIYLGVRQDQWRPQDVTLISPTCQVYFYIHGTRKERNGKSLRISLHFPKCPSISELLKDGTKIYSLTILRNNRAYELFVVTGGFKMSPLSTLVA